VRVIGLTGWSGAGKTTLLEAMLPWFVRQRISVSTVKHAHHGFDMDRPGKDSHRHRLAGAREVLVAGGDRWALLAETPDGLPPLSALLARLAPVDLVLIEGFKADPHPKIEVHRPALGKPPIWPGRPDIVAIATDTALESLDDCGGRAVLALSEPAEIAAWAWRYLRTAA